MKKILTTIVISTIVSLIPFAALATEASGPTEALREEPIEKPTPEEYEEAANTASGDFLCPSNPAVENPIQWKILQYAFIKKPQSQRISEACFYGSQAFILREETLKDGGRRVRAGIFLFGGNGGSKRYLERKSHNLPVLCELQDTSQLQSKALRVDYLCYNPTAATGFIRGEEFSFRLGKRNRSYRRDCTVFFGGPKEKECGKWKRLK